MFFDGKFSNWSQNCHLEPAFFPSIRDFVQPMNTLVQKKHNDSDNRITVKVS